MLNLVQVKPTQTAIFDKYIKFHLSVFSPIAVSPDEEQQRPLVSPIQVLTKSGLNNLGFVLKIKQTCSLFFYLYVFSLQNLESVLTPTCHCCTVFVVFVVFFIMYCILSAHLFDKHERPLIILFTHILQLKSSEYLRSRPLRTPLILEAKQEQLGTWIRDCRGNGKYCMIVFIHQGRCCFIFVFDF